MVRITNRNQPALSDKNRREILQKQGYNPDMYDLDENFRAQPKARNAQITSRRSAPIDPDLEEISTAREKTFLGEVIGTVTNPIEAIDRKINPKKYENDQSLSNKAAEFADNASDRLDNFEPENIATRTLKGWSKSLYNGIGDSIRGGQQNETNRKLDFNQTLTDVKTNPELKKELMARMIAQKEEMARKHPDYLEKARKYGQNSDWFMMTVVDSDPELAYQKFAKKIVSEGVNPKYYTGIKKAKHEAGKELDEKGVIVGGANLTAGLYEGFVDFLTDRVNAGYAGKVPGVDKAIPQMLDEGAQIWWNQIKGTGMLVKAMASKDLTIQQVMDDIDRKNTEITTSNDQKYAFLQEHREDIKKQIAENMFSSDDSAIAEIGRTGGSIGGDIYEFMTFYRAFKAAQLSQLNAAGKVGRAKRLKDGFATFEEAIPDLAASIPVSIIQTVEEGGTEEDFMRIYGENAAFGAGAVLGEKALRGMYKKIKDIPFAELSPSDSTRESIRAIREVIEKNSKNPGFVNFGEMANDASNAAKKISGKTDGISYEEAKKKFVKNINNKADDDTFIKDFGDEKNIKKIENDMLDQYESAVKSVNDAGGRKNASSGDIIRLDDAKNALKKITNIRKKLENKKKLDFSEKGTFTRFRKGKDEYMIASAQNPMAKQLDEAANSKLDKDFSDFLDKNKIDYRTQKGVYDNKEMSKLILVKNQKQRAKIDEWLQKNSPQEENIIVRDGKAYRYDPRTKEAYFVDLDTFKGDLARGSDADNYYSEIDGRKYQLPLYRDSDIMMTSKEFEKIYSNANKRSPNNTKKLATSARKGGKPKKQLEKRTNKKTDKGGQKKPKKSKDGSLKVSDSRKKINKNLPEDSRVREEYRVKTNKAAVKKASDLIKKDSSAAMEIINGKRPEGDLNRMAVASVAMRKAEQEGNFQLLKKLYTTTSQNITATAQNLQAVKLLHKTRPEYQFVDDVIKSRMGKYKMGNPKDAKELLPKYAEGVKKEIAKLKKLKREIFDQALSNLLC